MIKAFKILGFVLLTATLSSSLVGCGGKRRRQSPVSDPVISSGDESRREMSSFDDSIKARAALDSKDYSTAKSIAGSMIAKNPKDARAHYLLGTALHENGELTKARQSLELAAQLAPENRNFARALYACLSSIADSYIKQDAPSEAIELYKTVLSNNYLPGQTSEKLARSYSLTVGHLNSEGDKSQAETLLREAINILPDRLELQLQLAETLIDGNRLMEADRLLRTVTRLNPNYEQALISHANLSYRMGEVRQARELVIKALTIAPANRQALMLRAEIDRDQPILVTQPLDILLTPAAAKEQLAALKESNSFSAVRDFLTPLANRFPEEAWIHKELSIVEESMGNIAKALEHAEKSATLAPDNTDIQLQLIRCLYQQGDTQKAMIIMEKVETTDENQLRILDEKGQILARMGNFDKARELWNEVLIANPDYASTCFNFGQLEMESGNTTQARAHFDRALASEPTSPKFLYFAGVNLIQSGLKEQANEMWRNSANQLNPEDPYSARIYAALGQVPPEPQILAQSTLEPPAINFQQPPEIDTGVISAIAPPAVINTADHPEYDRGLEYARAGMFDHAIASFESVIGRNPNHFNALMNLGKVYSARNDAANACAYFLKALKVDPRNIFALKDLANSYAEVGLHSFAAQISQQVEANFPGQSEGFPKYQGARTPRNSPRAFEPIASALVNQQLNNEALAVIQTGIAQHPDNNALHLLQGDVYKQLEQFESALDTYRVAQQKEPQSPKPLVRIGDLYISAGQTSAAMAEYHKALRTDFIDPDTMFDIVERYRSIGRETEARRLLGHLKTHNLNQNQIKRLEYYLGETLVIQPEEIQTP